MTKQNNDDRNTVTRALAAMLHIAGHLEDGGETDKANLLRQRSCQAREAADRLWAALRDGRT